MTRQENTAAAAVQDYLRRCQIAFVRLVEIERVAEAATREQGRRRALFADLYGYLALLPEGSRVGVSGYQFGVLNPFCTKGATTAFREHDRATLQRLAAVARDGLTRHQRAARTAVTALLRNLPESTIPMYRVSTAADLAAANVGRKTELFASLYTYADILPQGCQAGWFESFWCAVNPWSGKPLPQDRGMMAGPFDVAVDFGPDIPPMLPDLPVSAYSG